MDNGNFFFFVSRRVCPALVQCRTTDNGKLNGVIFLDIKKAFDSINHGILLNKMKKRFGISSIELKWFESYLSNGEQQCSN